MFLIPNGVVDGAAVVVNDHELPLPPFESAVAAPCPIDVRSAATDSRLLFGSVTVHVSVVKVVPFAGTLPGANAQLAMTGGGSVTVSDAGAVGLLAVSFAVTVMLLSPNGDVVVFADVVSV